MSRIIMPMPPEWSRQDIVLYHIRKLGAHISAISERPYDWDRWHPEVQCQWLNDLQQNLTLYAAVMGRLTMALSFSQSTITTKQGTHPADALVDAVLGAIYEVSQDYLPMASDRQPKPYNPLLRGQSICLNCNHWKSNSGEVGTCAQQETMRLFQSTHSCSLFQLLSFDTASASAEVPHA
jgi:hypothetical protein